VLLPEVYWLPEAPVEIFVAPEVVPEVTPEVVPVTVPDVVPDPPLTPEPKPDKVLDAVCPDVPVAYWLDVPLEYPIFPITLCPLVVPVCGCPLLVPAWYLPDWYTLEPVPCGLPLWYELEATLDPLPCIFPPW
jgi:hypothetical protein